MEKAWAEKSKTVDVSGKNGPSVIETAKTVYRSAVE